MNPKKLKNFVSKSALGDRARTKKAPAKAAGVLLKTALLHSICRANRENRENEHDHKH
jgi:hypothetical protein